MNKIISTSFNIQFIEAASKGDLATVNILLPDVNIDSKGHFCRTALMEASKSGHFYVVKRLVEAGANTNEEDYQGNTTLVYAIDTSWYDIEIIKLLLEHGIKINKTNMVILL